MAEDVSWTGKIKTPFVLSTGRAALTVILLLQVATESGIVGVVVVEALAIARARGGVYKVVCQTGPFAGQYSVLKHGARPEVMAQLRERRVNIVHWHQVSFWFIYTSNNNLCAALLTAHICCEKLTVQRGALWHPGALVHL